VTCGVLIKGLFVAVGGRNQHAGGHVSGPADPRRPPDQGWSRDEGTHPQTATSMC